MKLPASLQARSSAESVDEDIEPWRGKTLEEKARAVDALSQLALDLLLANANPERAAAWQDPVPQSTLEHWRRLMHGNRR